MKGRVEMITTANIFGMLKNLFPYWIKTCGGGRGPAHIYYFRDGVSEGQYLHVLEQEVHDMKDFIAKSFGDAAVADVSFYLAT